MSNHRKRLHDPRLTAMPVLLALASSLTACAPHARQVRTVTAEPRWTDLPRPVLPANADRPPTQRAQTAHVPALPIVPPPVLVKRTSAFGSGGRPRVYTSDFG